MENKMSKIDELIEKKLSERFNLDGATVRRMDGLVLQRELLDMQISAVEVATDLAEELFDGQDIREYLKYKMDSALDKINWDRI